MNDEVGRLAGVLLNVVTRNLCKVYSLAVQNVNSQFTAVFIIKMSKVD